MSCADHTWCRHVDGSERVEVLRERFGVRLQGLEYRHLDHPWSGGLPASLRRKAAALAATHPAWGGRVDVSLGWVLVHMIEEYSRHNGQADLLREQIDGQTGE